jgi:hypothetical protein
MHAALDQALDPEPSRKRRRERDAGVRHHPLIVEDHPHAAHSDRLVVLYHEGDLLMPGPGCPYSLERPRSGGHSSLIIGRNLLPSSVDSG